MTTEDLLDLLERVTKVPGGWKARCPAHNDRTPSLSINENEDGRILLKCHAGCPYEDIIVALGINSRELSGLASEKPVEKDDAEQVYDYVDENGELLFQAVRFPGKKFRQRKPDGEYNLSGVRRVLYRLPEVVHVASNHLPIFICEGEKDVDAICNTAMYATCNPMGAKKWDDEYSKCLVGAAGVAIIVDKDEVGRQHAAMVRDSLRRVGIEPKLLQAKRGKDAWDHLVKYGYSMTDFVPVKEERVPTVITASQMADNALKALSAKEGSKPSYPNPWGFDDPEFVPGRLYIVGAWTGGGKSAAFGQIFRHLSEQGRRVGLLTNEMTEQDFRNRLLCHKGFKLKELEKPWTLSSKVGVRTEIEQIRSWNSEIIFDTSANHRKAAEYLEEGAYDILLFDHLHNIDAVRGGEEAVINKEIGGFASLALDYDVPVIVAGQFRRLPPGQGIQRPVIQDFKGSGAIEQNAAMALAFWREKGSTQAEMLILKNRHGVSDVTYYLNFKGSQFLFERRPEAHVVSTNPLVA